MRIVPFIGGEGKGSIPPTLEELDLSDNSFDDMPRNTFRPFSNLKKLNLSKNGLSDFEAVTFVGLKKLEVLDLSFNRFTEVPNKALRVTIRENYFTKIFLERLFTKIFLAKALFRIIWDFQIISGLKKLLIGGNEIVSLTSMEFAPLSSLKILNINGLKKLTDITKDTFNGLTGLEELWFSDSKLSAIPGKAL